MLYKNVVVVDKARKSQGGKRPTTKVSLHFLKKVIMRLTILQGGSVTILLFPKETKCS